MNNKFKWILVAIIATFASISYAQNRLYTDDFELSAGETKEIVLYLDNNTEYTSFQVDIYLPKGISITQDVDGYYNIFGSTRIRRHTVESQFHSEGNFTRIIGYTTNNAKISGTSGELLYIEIQADENFAGNHYLRLSNVRFATPPSEDGTIQEDLFEEETFAITGPAVDEVQLQFADTYYSGLTLYTSKGSSEKFKIEASDKSNGIKSVFYNSVDVTDEIIDGLFTTPALENDATLYILYDISQEESSIMKAPTNEIENKDVALKIIDSEYGTMTLYKEPGERVKLGFKPQSEFYLINTILFNGEDVTSELVDGIFTTPYITEESTLNISYTIPTIENSISYNSAIKVYVDSGDIIIAGCKEGDTINIYNTSGLLMHTQKATKELERIAMQKNLIYVVTVADTTVKVAN